MTHWFEVFRYEVRQQFRRKSYLFITFGVPILALVIFFGYQVYRDMTRGDEEAPAPITEVNKETRTIGYVDQTPGGLFPPPETARPEYSTRSAVDMDGTHFSSPPPGLTTSDIDLGANAVFGVDDIRHGFGQAAAEQRPFSRSIAFDDDVFDDDALPGDEPGKARFSDSLMTSDDYDT